MGMTVMVNWFFVAWMIRLAEAQYNYSQGSNEGVSAFLDTLWLVPITFTTIGYGDFYPRSYSRYLFNCPFFGTLIVRKRTIKRKLNFQNRIFKPIMGTIHKISIEKHINRQNRQKFDIEKLKISIFKFHQITLKITEFKILNRNRP